MGQDTDVRTVMEDVVRDRVYYRRSGGGLTLSGGECFFQHEFATALLKAAKMQGINTAIETTSCVKYEKILEALPYIDYYLMDIKHMNSAKHKEYTGAPNELMLENAKRLAQDAKSLTIRVPVIPGFNDTEAEITDIAKFAASLKAVKQLHLLPYHRLGKDKYEGLKRDYLMGDAPLHTPEEIERLRQAAQRCGIDVVIGC